MRVYNQDVAPTQREEDRRDLIPRALACLNVLKIFILAVLSLARSPSISLFITQDVPESVTLISSEINNA